MRFRGRTHLLWTAACLWACATAQPPAPAAPLATSLQELMPHADRDHFVYIWERTMDGQRVAAGMQVEHLTLVGNGEFDVTVSEDGSAIGHTRFRDDGQALLLLAEDLGQNLRLSYDPPLPQVVVPLLAGEQRAASTATVTQVSDGKQVGTMQVVQVMRASRAPALRSLLGTFDHPVLLETQRTLQTPEGAIELRTAAIVVAGIGEVRSSGTATGAPTVHRELACAILSGHSYGDCHSLAERIEELNDAGPTDDR